VFNRGLLQHRASSDVVVPALPIPGLHQGDRICSDLPFGPFALADGEIDSDGFNRWQLSASNLDWASLNGLRSTLSLTPTLPGELDRLCSVPDVCADVCARMLGARWRVLPADEAAPLLASGELREVARWGRPMLLALEDLHAAAYASLRPAHSYSDPWKLEVALHDGRLLPGDFAFVANGTLVSPDAYTGRGEVDLRSRAPGELRLGAHLEAPALLAVREGFTRGWRARIDGRPLTPIPVNLGMVGLAVPAGVHEIELRFVPWTWPGALILYGLGWAAALLLLVRTRHKPSPASTSARSGPENAQGQPQGR
jgi:hypothetical protein